MAGTGQFTMQMGVGHWTFSGRGRTGRDRIRDKTRWSLRWREGLDRMDKTWEQVVFLAHLLVWHFSSLPSQPPPPPPSLPPTILFFHFPLSFLSISLLAFYRLFPQPATAPHPPISGPPFFSTLPTRCCCSHAPCHYDDILLHFLGKLAAPRDSPY